ncbi:hypothetical protein SAMN05216551_105211 [Chitinasiproducens palmae]|uniref:Uncharacterized protein n=1 Tax=Chitinasiproducens palmae TaxID=1770053 RepID=A0A1H2PPI8_9BURK|nr:hypothetical protein SAMN05216551_105211 [Chitinasiproducens palmae]
MPGVMQVALYWLGANGVVVAVACLRAGTRAFIAHRAVPTGGMSQAQA